MHSSRRSLQTKACNAGSYLEASLQPSVFIVLHSSEEAVVAGIKVLMLRVKDEKVRQPKLYSSAALAGGLRTCPFPCCSSPEPFMRRISNKIGWSMSRPAHGTPNLHKKGLLQVRLLYREWNSCNSGVPKVSGAACRSVPSYGQLWLRISAGAYEVP